MTGRWRQLLPCLLAPVLAACSASPMAEPAAPADLPAVLLAPDAAMRRELHAALAQLLSVPQVLVADPAFTRDSSLIIEKVRPRGADGVQLTGRDYDKPEQFRLVKSGASCVLVRVRTGARLILPQARCAAVAPE